MRGDMQLPPSGPGDWDGRRRAPPPSACAPLQFKALLIILAHHLNSEHPAKCRNHWDQMNEAGAADEAKP
eukprot:911652-Amphidinium_carterae.1